MSAYYDLYQNPPAQGKKEEELPSFHARIVSCGTVDTDAIARDIEANTSFTYGDVVGVLGCLQQELIKRLSDGYQVNLDGLGIFSAGLKCSPVTDKKEVRSRDVQLSDIHFRPAAKLKRNLKRDMRLTRNPNSSANGIMPMEKAIDKVLEYLTEHNCIDRQEVSRLTGYKKVRAVSALNTWRAQGILIRHGYGKAVIYFNIKKSR